MTSVQIMKNKGFHNEVSPYKLTVLKDLRMSVNETDD